MAVAPIPFPVPVTHKQAVQAENWAAINALYPAALTALRERLETANDITAAKLIVEACLPKGRAVALGDISPAGIERALAAGRISPAEASAMASAVKACREIVELDALAQRIAALESALAMVRR